MALSRINIKDFRGGWNTSDSTIIADNELSLAQNMFYDKDKNLTTRRGFNIFSNDITDTQHSIYFTKFSDGTRILLMGAGTNMYEYNEGTSQWDVIKAGLTDGLRFSFVTYKDIIYWSNGTDNFMSYNGVAVSEHAAALKPKYLIIANDVAYCAGVSTDASILFYSNANPADLQTTLTAGAANNEAINEDDGQVITGLQPLGHRVVVGKDDSVYNVDTTAAAVTIEKIDHNSGVISHRSMVNVENSLLHFSREGVYDIAQRSGTIGNMRARSLTDDIYTIIKNAGNKTLAAGFYLPETKNYYLAIDYEAAGRNSSILVYSVLTQGWTIYKGYSANDFTVYEDATGARHLLIANSFGGQTYDIETSFTDNELAIGCKAQTKTFDFEAPEQTKVLAYVDIIGFTSKQADIDVVIDVDGTETTKTIDGNAYAIGAAADVHSLGESALGIEPLGGGAVGSGLQLFPFLARVPLYKAGRRIRVKLESDNLNAAWQLAKLTVWVEGMPVDVIANDYIF